MLDFYVSDGFKSTICFLHVAASYSIYCNSLDKNSVKLNSAIFLFHV